MARRKRGTVRDGEREAREVNTERVQERVLEALDAEEPMGREAEAIADRATAAGERRLHRRLLQESITALIGGMSVGFGMVALILAGGAVSDPGGDGLGLLIGALAFPVGFVILLIGKSELFTENFLVPVMGVLDRRGTVGNLGRLWSVSLVFNLAGALLFALLISRDGVLDGPSVLFLENLVQSKLEASWSTSLVQALFAGWLMTILTWLLLACRTVFERVVVIWVVGTLLILGDFNHVVISSAEYFTVALGSGGYPLGEFFLGVFVPGIIGNMIGGVVFVTLLHYVQAHPEFPRR